MSTDTYIQLLIVGIILSSLLFYSKYQSSYAELVTKAGETSDETLDVDIPLPTISAQEHGRGQELTSQQYDVNNGIPLELPFP
jgi:hypothetical protein